MDKTAEHGLPAGTRVQMRDRAKLKGTVMPYAPEYSHGLFPVRFDNCIWQICHAGDVIVLDATEASRSVSERNPHGRRKVSKRLARERGDGDGLGQVVGCATRATTDPAMAGSPDLADLPTMRKLLVFAER